MNDFVSEWKNSWFLLEVNFVSPVIKDSIDVGGSVANSLVMKLHFLIFETNCLKSWFVMMTDY